MLGDQEETRSRGSGAADQDQEQRVRSSRSGPGADGPALSDLIPRPNIKTETEASPRDWPLISISSSTLRGRPIDQPHGLVGTTGWNTDAGRYIQL
ncbi:hypothetical protein EYF80_021509 [Liparis tanakae]|uniref:Uncharacterized protein n=1 Tax=Liparis tanakae TaxID=230148 RepID=A0A4Z2HR61_9TELE|nr:hypothetical protein EYF80_021509 [Liparis tanakae]